MKLILSRKGFDSGSGGCPSPILPDGTMVSLPIPLRASPKTYEEIAWTRGRSVGELIRDLAPAKIQPDFRAHLDPDLRRRSLPRPKGWRPLFGQIDQAQSHLARHGIGPGDLFLFFGLYRRVSEQAGRLRFVPGAKAAHVLFGWLQVESVQVADTCSAQLPWAADHPHFHMKPNPRNVVYVSRRVLNLTGTSGLPGAGVFERFSPELQLTAPDASGVSEWQLPRWFAPKGRPALSYHGRPDRWVPHPDGVRLRSVGRGQEFVLDTTAYPEAVGWLAGLLNQWATRR